MVPGKMAVTGMIVMALLAGCTKQKSGSDKQFTSADQSAVTPAPAAQQDIFDEFYKADSSATPKTQSKSTRRESASRSYTGGAPSFVEGGRYVVQVATHPSQKLAEATKEKLSAKGYPCYIAEVQNPTPALGGTYYRVRIGGFNGTAAARAFGEQSLAPEGYQYWVDNRSNDNVGLSGSGLGSGSSSYGTEPQTPPAYQSSSYEAAPAPEPAAPPPEPAPVVKPAAKPAPAPASSTTPAGSTPATQSEWGNDGW